MQPLSSPVQHQLQGQYPALSQGTGQVQNPFQVPVQAPAQGTGQVPNQGANSLPVHQDPTSNQFQVPNQFPGQALAQGPAQVPYPAPAQGPAAVLGIPIYAAPEECCPARYPLTLGLSCCASALALGGIGVLSQYTGTSPLIPYLFYGAGAVICTPTTAVCCAHREQISCANCKTEVQNMKDATTKWCERQNLAPQPRGMN